MFLKRIVIYFVIAFVNGVHSMNRVCYYTNWAQYRPGAGKYVPEDMDPHLCTHIIYSFAKLNGNLLAPFEWNDESTEWMKGMYEKFNSIKQQNPSIKTLLAIGGWNMGSEPFTQMVKTTQTRKEFIKSSVDFLRQRNFDGLDLDWEYPANRGSPPKDKHRFTMLVQELREAFERDALVTGRPRLLLTAAVAAGKKNIDSGYDVPALGRMLDFISIMTYDLHGSWESTTGHNSPLFARSGETGEDRFLNLDWAANYWHKMGVPKSKLNIGLGLYGRSFTLADRNVKNVGAKASGKGKAGEFTREAGFLSYYEVCDMMKHGGKKYYINEQKVPYLVKDDQWVGYDDVDSLSIKVQYVKQQRFAGIMVWALDLDDFKGSCGQGRYPLLKRINQELEGSSYQPDYSIMNIPSIPDILNQHVPVAPPPQVHHEPVRHQPPPPRSRAPVLPPVQHAPLHPPVHTVDQHRASSTDFTCQRGYDGYFPSPDSCSKYYMCTDGTAFKFNCAPGLKFNKEHNFCDWPEKVNCNDNTSTKKSSKKNKKRVRQESLLPPTPPIHHPEPPQYKPQPPPPQYQPQPPPQPPPTSGWNFNNINAHADLPPPVPSSPTNSQQSSAWDWVSMIDNPMPFFMSLFGNNDLFTDMCANKPNGIYPQTDNCRGFLECSEGVSFKGSCGPGLAFNPGQQTCDYMHNVPGCQ